MKSGRRSRQVGSPTAVARIAPRRLSVKLGVVRTFSSFARVSFCSINPLVNSQPRETKLFPHGNLPDLTLPFSDLASRKRSVGLSVAESFLFFLVVSYQTIPFPASRKRHLLRTLLYSLTLRPLHISNPQGTLILDTDPRLCVSEPPTFSFFTFRRHINQNHQLSPRDIRTHPKPNSHLCLIFPLADILPDRKKQGKNQFDTLPSRIRFCALRECYIVVLLRAVAVLFAVHRVWGTCKRNANSSANHFLTSYDIIASKITYLFFTHSLYFVTITPST